jgi:diaminohydroxyphosphoribosylaminopyrimidine deaminase/5-amino-6-(5-phosphoribosylamino)uracil reductase
VRLVKGRSPFRIVTDSRLRIALSSKVLKEQEVARTIIATTSQADSEKLSSLTQMGIEILSVEEDTEGKVNLRDLLSKLGGMNISSVLVEGGTAIITSLIRQRLVDKYIVMAYRNGQDLIIEAKPQVDEA